MGQNIHVLIDTERSIVADGEIASGGSWSVRMRTLRGGRSEGVQVVEIDNGHFCIDVLPTRGMGIWRVRRHSPNPSPERRGEKNVPLPFREGLGEGSVLGWTPPAALPVNPAFVPLMEPAGLGWLDGFCELLCRCGLESNGPPEFDDAGRLLRPLHGRISNTPAHRVELIVDESEGRIALRGVVDESRFHFQSLRLTATISTVIGSNDFSWDDEVENIGGREAMLQMLYHFNIGQPLLREGSQISAPLTAVAPLTRVAAEEGVVRWNMIPPSRPESSEQVFGLNLASPDEGDTRLLVSGLANNEAVELQFNKRTLPCFTIWRNTPAEKDGYVLGIEPGTNYPNPRTFEDAQGRVIRLKSGETWRTLVTATWHQDAKAIAASQAAIEAIQAACEPEISESPRGDWSANP